MDPNDIEIIVSQPVSVDRDGPTVPELSASPTSVSPGGSFAITARVQDPSGVESAGFYFTLNGAQRDFCGQELARTSGTATDGIWTHTCQVPQNVQGGVYTIVPYAVDIVGNYTNTNCCSTSPTRCVNRACLASSKYFQ